MTQSRTGPPARFRPTRRTLRVAAAALTGLVTLLAVGATAGCAGQTQRSSDTSITVWSLENNAERVRLIQQNLARFTQHTGIRVRLVPVDMDQFPSLVTSAAAADDLPDVIGVVGLAHVRQLSVNQLLHPTAVGEVVQALGRQTFLPRALRLTADRGRQLAVPSDGWGQILVYRRDLFAAAGLAPPEDYQRLLAAARALHRPGRAGIALATAPDATMTQETFEHLALANGCQLTDRTGRVALDSPACVQALRLYTELARSYSVPGSQNVESTRATYFSGRAAMVLWSSFLLDELAGLRNNARPSCQQCRADPGFLARNSGVVTRLRGPLGGEPAQYGEITSWTVTAHARTAPAKRLIEYMMSEGYPDWLRMAPEGKFPVRAGIRTDPQRYTRAWAQAEAGVDTKAPLSRFYGPQVLAALGASPGSFQRWGLEQGQGDLVGGILGELPVPRTIAELAGSGGDLDRAVAAGARQTTEEVTAIQESLR